MNKLLCDKCICFKQSAFYDDNRYENPKFFYYCHLDREGIKRGFAEMIEDSIPEQKYYPYDIPKYCPFTLEQLLSRETKTW